MGSFSPAVVPVKGLLRFRAGCGAGLGGEPGPAAAPAAICRRIVAGQSLYAFGALLCLFNTYWSIAFIVLVQLNYAIAPKIGRRRE